MSEQSQGRWENSLVVLPVCTSCSVFNDYEARACENCGAEMLPQAGWVITTLAIGRRLMPGFEDTDFQRPKLQLVRDLATFTEVCDQQRAPRPEDEGLGDA